ncbi:uncharacterized protein PHALS_05767 [Plasmopara halstedii]|uniref:Uncharacterized protein n=1 Tax=Plasmopara halstedii TaxID=4781 RepID=A0A0P1ABN8_PLAHL|nr:uncharacterized protein PHALS_05767 [Plasmopara halstedii]CEG37709.1 hypothetical protein PHALS_05767 [Plasmopara halstedii]|eukprot:XP_024574078.1 hypothetical protein PHALS_05767 [Plasmopara halstedii]
MPSTETLPLPELYEPYENYKYADLCLELSKRNICLPRSLQRVTDQAGLIQLLRDWDQTQNEEICKPIYRRASPRRQGDKIPNQMNSKRTIRTRRGCRFRLINVLLSPKFCRRWSEMISCGRKLEMNHFWTDVHVAFRTKNLSLDKLHFQDALFVNVTPDVILAHSATRLLQMWIEIVIMYRNAVAQAKRAADKNDTVHSFFDFCAGRLDLLYLHMAMLLEPKLSRFVMSDKLSAAFEPFDRSKIKTVASDSKSAQTAVKCKSGALNKVQSTVAASSKPVTTVSIQDAAKCKTGTTNKGKFSASCNPSAIIEKVGSTTIGNPSAATGTEAATSANSQQAILTEAQSVIATSKPIEETEAEAATPADNKLAAGFGDQIASADSSNLDTEISTVAGKAMETALVTSTTKPPAPPKLPGMLTQNPEMKEIPASPEIRVGKSTLAKDVVLTRVNQSKPAVSQYKASVPKKIRKYTGKGKAATNATSTRETKPMSSSAKKQSAKSKAKTSQSVKLSTIGDDDAQKISLGKRSREEKETTIIQIPTITDIVPHPAKRAHTTTALVTRPMDVALPPDEWDILENRLRKVNDNIGRCHRGLSGMEGKVSDSYKQSLEADLRFYSAIKQRLQEQLLVVMQSGY